MIKTNLTNKVINLKDLEENKKYNLILKLRTSDVTMENLNSSEVYNEVNALSINCAFLKHPLTYFITEYKSKNL